MNFLAGLELSEDPLAALTSEERQALDSFRGAYERGRPEGEDAAAVPSFTPALPLPSSGWRPLDDYTLWRFLSADRRKGQFDQVASLQRLTKTLLWRKELSVDSLMESPPDGALRSLGMMVVRYPGLTAADELVVATRVGAWVASGNMRLLQKDELVTHVARQSERLAWYMRYHASKLRRPVRRMVMIFDTFGGLDSLRNFKHFISSGVDHSAHYPELLASVMAVNAPTALSSLYNSVVKRILDPAVAAKVHLLSSKASPATLQELIPASVLFEEYGGSNTAAYPSYSEAAITPKSDSKEAGAEYEPVRAAIREEMELFRRQEGAVASRAEDETARRVSRKLNGDPDLNDDNESPDTVDVNAR